MCILRTPPPLMAQFTTSDTKKQSQKLLPSYY